MDVGPTMPVCDIIIPLHDNREDTENCLRQLAENSDVAYRLMLVDDGSGPETAAWLRDIAERDLYGATDLVRTEQNLRWTGAVNLGLEKSTAPYICLLNNDTLPGPAWLGRLIAHLERHPAMAFIQPLGNDRSLRDLVAADIPGHARRLAAENPGRFTRLSYISGFCLVMPRRTYDLLGTFDPAYPQGHWADHDYCRRAQDLGLFAAEARDALVFHLENRTINRVAQNWKEVSRRAEEIFIQRWGSKQGVFWLPPRPLTGPGAAEEMAAATAVADRGHDLYVALPRRADPASLFSEPGQSGHSNIKWQVCPLPNALFPLWAAYLRRYLEHKKRASLVWHGPAAGLADFLAENAALNPGRRAK